MFVICSFVVCRLLGVDLVLCAYVFRLSARVNRPLTAAEAGAGAAVPYVDTCTRNGLDMHATDHSLDDDVAMAMLLTFTCDAMWTVGLGHMYL